jgi:CRP-like cAMP-binding protein
VSVGAFYPVRLLRETRITIEKRKPADLPRGALILRGLSTSEGRKNSLEKVAAFLLEMDRRLSGTGVIALPMSRRDIADYPGLSLETVSRELSQLRASGVLKFAPTSQRQIMLEDRQKLQTFNS